MHRRVAVRGVAGSGKSLLALEVARRQAALGKQVLHLLQPSPGRLGQNLP
ncbi:MAG: hypothetical protein R2839_03675 [Thermomicrobiales bacterium]